MKKLFCIVPYNGRSERAIRNSYSIMHNIAQRLTGEKMELIESYNPALFRAETNPVIDPDWANKPVMNNRVYSLGRSIEMMAYADYVAYATLDNLPGSYPGCKSELFIARQYGLRTIPLGDARFIFTDLIKEEK